MKKVLPKDAVLIPDNAKNMFKGIIFDVYQWQQVRFDGSLSTWEMLKRPDTSEVICIIDGKILVLEEEQPHSGSSISFPGGRADSDVTILDAAKREVLEETGYSFKNWLLIDVRQPHTKNEWFIHLFVAWNVNTKTNTHLDAGEKIIPTLMTFDEVKKLSLSNKRYICERRSLFEKLNSIDELLDMEEFEGLEVDR
jgi:ADP-ribose pyrophosphatase